MNGNKSVTVGNACLYNKHNIHSDDDDHSDDEIESGSTLERDSQGVTNSRPQY